MPPGIKFWCCFSDVVQLLMKKYSFIHIVLFNVAFEFKVWGWNRRDYSKQFSRWILHVYFEMPVMLVSHLQNLTKRLAHTKFLKLIHKSKAFSGSLLPAIMARNHLPFFKIFSSVVHFCPHFQIFFTFLPFLNIFLPFFSLFLKNRIRNPTYSPCKSWWVSPDIWTLGIFSRYI